MDEQLSLFGSRPAAPVMTEPAPAPFMPTVQRPAMPKPRAAPQRRDRNPNRTTEMLRNIARLFFQGEIPANLLAQTIVERMGCPEPRAKMYADAIAQQVI